MVKKTTQKTPRRADKAKRTVHITRDARSGQYIVVRTVGAHGKGDETTVIPGSVSGPGKLERPDAFIKEFTKHPVVDRVMRRMVRSCTPTRLRRPQCCGEGSPKGIHSETGISAAVGPWPRIT